MTPGETLVLYTDGVSEAENEAGDEYALSDCVALSRSSPRAALSSW